MDDVDVALGQLVWRRLVVFVIGVGMVMIALAM